jgi:tetratricopeptide (TPR) repeat protein
LPDIGLKSANMIERLYNHRRLLICILLAAVTLAVYLPVRNYEFLHYDDDVYVTDNTAVKSGLSRQGVEWAFTTGHAANWHPLTWLSLMLDCQLFGVKAGPMHVVSVLFHVANTILLFLVLARMTKGVWQSAFIAALFALHPLHVESVAWIAERKDVLSTLFWLLTMLAYVRYAERPSAGRYIAVLVLFAVGLMAKPMLVTLPFVLLLLDYWPLERRTEDRGQKTKDGNRKASLKWLIIEKIPLIALSAASSVVTFIFQQRGGAVIESNKILLDERVLNAVVSYLAYLGKMVWPVNLAALYPHPVDTIPVWRAVISGVVLILITIFVVYHARRYKYLLVGWFWYLGTLVPVIGIVQVGAQAMADRYTYVPLIGIFIIIAFGTEELLKEKPFRKIVLGVLAGVSLSACAVVTSHQIKYWKDSLSLFEHTLNIVTDSPIMENNYANILMDKGRPAEAVAYLSKAIKLHPGSPEIHNNYGNALRETGKVDEAIEHYKIALKLNPDFTLARYQLGVALAAKGDYEGAIQQYRIYAGTAVDLADIRQGLAAELAKEGKVDEAVNQFQQAMIVKPDSTEVLSNFGYALAQSGKPKEAIEYYDKVLATDPNNVITHGRLALALAFVGRIDEAVEQCRIVLTARPNDFEMYTNLGMLLQNQGKLDEAIESYKKALQIDPNFQKARENLNALIQNLSQH